MQNWAYCIKEARCVKLDCRLVFGMPKNPHKNIFRSQEGKSVFGLTLLSCKST